MGNVKIKKKAEIEARKLEQEKKKAEKEKFKNKKLTQNDINELVRMLAKEHGLI